MRDKKPKPCGSRLRLLQPLREIGLSEKTQCWDLEDIQAALREAYVLGIPVESLYGTAQSQDGLPERITVPCSTPKPTLPRRP